MKLLLAVFALIAVISCVRNDNQPAMQTLAWVPIYASVENVNEIKVESAKPIEKPGKIYVYQQYIFQNEYLKGIHVIDNSDPGHPEKKAFISVPFNTEMAIRNGYIYANSVDDLIVIDITDPLDARLLHRISKAFPLISQTSPPDAGYFVCPDPEKGVVIEWKLETVPTAACRR